jgi:hypothetical protein
MQAALHEAVANLTRYEHCRPEQTPLYRLVQLHYETFAAAVVGLPQYIKDEFEAYLECGISRLCGGGDVLRTASCACAARVAHATYWCLQLEAARHLPLLLHTAHGQDCRLSGDVLHPARAGVTVGAVVPDTPAQLVRRELVAKWHFHELIGMPNSGQSSTTARGRKLSHISKIVDH